MNKQLRLCALLFTAVLGFVPMISAVPVNLPSGPLRLDNSPTRFVGTIGISTVVWGLVGYLAVNRSFAIVPRSGHLTHDFP